MYHYHQTPICVYSEGNDEFIGVALDGYPIYGIKVSLVGLHISNIYPESALCNIILFYLVRAPHESS